MKRDPRLEVASKDIPADTGRRRYNPKHSTVMTKVIPALKSNINVVHCNLVNPEDGSVLVIQRSPDEEVNPGLWEKLSGKIEPDMLGTDTIARNVVREIWEELEVTVDVSEVYVAPRDNEILNVDHPKYDQIMVHPTYVVYVPRTKIHLKENGHVHHQFVRADNYHTLEYVSGVEESLEKYFKRRREEGILFPHELAQVIRCVIVDEIKERILMRKLASGQFTFPANHMGSGITPYTSIQQLMYNLNLHDEFKVAPLTAIHFPSNRQQAQELHHFFLVSGADRKLPDNIGRGEYQWFDIRQGYEFICKQVEVHNIRPSVRKVLTELLLPSLHVTMETLARDAVVRRPLRTRSNSII
ncbi:MAG: hypothetical protein A2V81_02615 [Candidatus Abawacabacteria bacterium RBG_16_42_10]|uniref:Nudix hydrolase domain-containing protein n=1 Tax=Candidatus Abawacabacteria bacterium RBG_16_42_10 TaxID=1817814 RepID=A0A1F4XL09_9BACT|nr:MAG: hypothetical protein A2V81_02615 [Candidatus Abawacabacteria bacterium RBG_16_42_10]